ncbi:Hypothetical_protein [Hexamita inflata]|uniref:Hypothetical_protein n=1 Tax=Hexamita inflata TaxID=28002 RepID=A0AA86U5B5_9EUKA|nr:Hypothetical protein HINF_LOCUS29144 [Hexamita inflata]
MRNSHHAASKSSYRQAKPYFNQQYLILADQNGLLEVLQSPTFAQTTQFSNNLRFSRQVMAPQQSKKEEKEVTSKDVYLKNLNSIISWINIVKAHAQKQAEAGMDENSKQELLSTTIRSSINLYVYVNYFQNLYYFFVQKPSLLKCKQELKIESFRCSSPAQLENSIECISRTRFRLCSRQT